MSQGYRKYLSEAYKELLKRYTNNQKDGEDVAVAKLIKEGLDKYYGFGNTKPTA